MKDSQKAFLIHLQRLSPLWFVDEQVYQEYTEIQFSHSNNATRQKNC